MKAKVITLMAMIAAGSALAADNFPAITTTDGKTYDHITAERADPDGLYIEFTPAGKGMGVAKLKFSRLSADLQKQFGYDADAAKKYEDDNYKASLAFLTWADQQDALRQKARAEAAARDFQIETILAQRAPIAADQAPSADYGNDTGGGWGYGATWPYGRPAGPNSWTGSTFRGTVPADRLFTPLGFSPNKTQVSPATPRSGANLGTSSERQR